METIVLLSLLSITTLSLVYFLLRIKRSQSKPQEQIAILEQKLQVALQEIALEKVKTQHMQEQYQQAQEKLLEKENRLLELQGNYSEVHTELRLAKEKLQVQKAELEQMQEHFRREFKVVANDILEEKSKRFSDQNKEQIGTILNPLREKILEFEKKVESTNKEQLSWNATLKTQIEHLRQTNQQITKEAESLSKALRGDKKAQGSWGEIQLEVLLEKVGLEKDVHYFKEKNLKNQEGENQRPDFILRMPDKKHIIIDAKVSLNAYTAYFQSDDEREKETLLKKHVQSIHEHIKGLSSKNYHKLYEIPQPDYVLLFVANEPALTIALKQDPELYEKALDQHIVLVSTTTLLATLRTVSYIWKQDLQSKNALEIAKKAGDLYDKFINFSEDLLQIGHHLDKSQQSYEEAMKKLKSGRGNLISRVEKLKEMGAKTEKQMDSKLLEE